MTTVTMIQCESATRTIEPMNPTKQKIAEAITKFREAQRELEALKETTFPIGMTVNVDCYVYSGRGIVTRKSSCPSDMVAVELENGVPWWCFCPVESCTPVEGKA